MRALLRSNQDVLTVMQTLEKHYFKDRRPVHCRTVDVQTKHNLSLLVGLFDEEALGSTYHVNLTLDSDGDISVMWSPNRAQPVLTAVCTTPTGVQYMCVYFSPEEAYALLVHRSGQWQEAEDQDEDDFVLEAHFNNLAILSS